MAQYRDIDLPSGVSLRINGELNLPSNSITLTTGNVNSNQVILGSQATASNQAVRADRSIVTTNTSGLLGGGDLTGDKSLAINWGGNGSATTASRSDHNHDTRYLLTTGNSSVISGNVTLNGGWLYLADTYGNTPHTIRSYGGGDTLWMIGKPNHSSLVLADNLDWDRSVQIDYIQGTSGASGGVLKIGQIQKNSQPTYTHGQTSLYTNGIEALRIDKSQNTSFFGNVGFGTTSPDSSFGITIGDYSNQNSNFGFKRAYNSPNLDNYSYLSGGTYFGYGVQPVNNRWMLWHSAYGNIMVALSGGNIGISDSNPAYKLSVGGDIKLTGRIYNDSSTVNFLQSTGSAQGIKAGSLVISSSYADQPPDNNNSAYILGMIRTNGGFGYLTSDLSKAPLWINGKVGNTTAIFGDTNPISFYQNFPGIMFNMYNNDGNYRTFTPNNYTGIFFMNGGTGDYQFFTGDNQTSGGALTNLTERMRITNGGNVGIGVTNPLYTLHTQVIAIDSYDSQLRQGYYTGNGKLNRSIGGAYGWDSNMLYINGFGDWASGVSVGSAPNNTSVNLTVTGALTANSTANILGNMTIGGSLYIGPSNGAGTAVVRNGTGANAIQLDGGMAGKLSGVNSYIDGNGNAQFSQTISANALIINSNTMVNNLNAQYLSGNPVTAFVQNATNIDMGGYGVLNGLSVSQLSPSPSNTTVILASGTVYTYSGMRVTIPTQNVVTSVNNNTSDRIDLVYIKGPSANLLEGNIGIIQGAYGSPPTAPTCPNDGVPIAQLYMRASSATIQNSNITDVRQWKPIDFNSDGSSSFMVNTQIKTDKIKSISNTTIQMLSPLKGSSWATTLSFSSGTQSIAWNHNLNLSNYAISLSSSSSERHINWTNKTSNSISVQIDDIDNDETVYVDCIIIAY